MPSLPEPECRRRFASVPVARLATVAADGRPHLVPMVFALDGDDVYGAVDAKPKSGLRLRRLGNIEATGVASLLVDRYDDDWAQLWWVRADGSARVVPAGAGAARARELLAARYPQYGGTPPDGEVLAVRVTRWTGWAAR